jgi:hypothetical protein
MDRAAPRAARFQAVRTGQTLPCVALGRAGWLAATAISRLIVPHRVDASSIRQAPAEGEATSASQKYGGPPCRSFDFAATLPSGAISESSPSSGFSAAKMTRRGAPFHGAIGEGRTAISAASSQAPPAPCACAPTVERRMTGHAPAISHNAVAAAANRCIENNRAPVSAPDRLSIGKLWLNHGEIHRHGRRVRSRPSPLKHGKSRCFASYPGSGSRGGRRGALLSGA